LGGIAALSGGGQGGDASGLVAQLRPQVVGEWRLGGEGIGEETSGGCIALGTNTQVSEQQALRWIGLVVAAQDGGQAPLQLKELLALTQLLRCLGACPARSAAARRGTAVGTRNTIGGTGSASG
jgi:hypothetical protein